MYNKYLNTSNYKKICDKLNQILMDENSSKVTYSIPWLHVLKNHNEVSLQYSHLFDDNQLKNNKFFFFKKKQIEKLFKIIFSREKKTILDKKTNIDYIFISHLVNLEQLSYAHDYYFNDLPNFLSKKNKVLVLFINHTNTSKNKIKFKGINENFLRIVLPNSLGFFNELKNIFQLMNLIESEQDAREEEELQQAILASLQDISGN